MGTVCAFSSVAIAQAAEKIYFNYGPLNFPLGVNSLRKYAIEGEVDGDLRTYLKLVGKNQQDSLRKALNQRVDVDPVLLSRFLNTKAGERVLDNVGRTITIQGGSNGKYAIRGALVLAAQEPEGLTLLNFIEKFPTNMQVDVSDGFRLAGEISRLVEAAELFGSQIDRISKP